jgi:hypothetical protein
MITVVHNIAISPWAMTPFLLMLGAIAVFPLVVPHFWDNNRNKLIVAVLLSVTTIIYVLKAGFSHELYNSIH